MVYLTLSWPDEVLTESKIRLLSVVIWLTFVVLIVTVMYIELY